LENRPILGDLKTHPANETIGTASRNRTRDNGHVQ